MDILNAVSNMDHGTLFKYIIFISRFVLPVLGGVVILRSIFSLYRERASPEQWGVLSFPGGTKMPLHHWENIIGRSVSSDIALKYPTLSRTHGALVRNAKGQWRVFDLKSSGGITVDSRTVPPEGKSVKNGTVISFGGVDAVFLPKNKTETEETERPIKSGLTLFLLIEFQLFLGLTVWSSKWDVTTFEIPVAFALLIIFTLTSYILTRLMGRRGFEIEIMAFFLCTIGLGITCSSVPKEAITSILHLAGGLIIYFLLGWFLRDLKRALGIRWPLAIGGLGLLAVNIVFGGVLFGAKNWLAVAGQSFQPSEFVKIAFVIAGSATLDRLFVRRNLFLFVGFAGACVGALALMGDFGTALVFFAAYLVIAFLRSGDFATILLSIAGAFFGGVLALTAKSHIASRFSGWLHAWDDVYGKGFQQTRAMAAAASGGLLGMGAGQGWLVNIFAANTDLVFGVMCEELGLITALIAVGALIAISIFPIRSSARGRSSFYVIAGCAAGAIFLVQAALNILGSMDILPFTGVTLPFISKGGSSLMACWGLLALIKAGDTRLGASFIVRDER